MAPVNRAKLERLEKRLEMYYEAEEKILQGQSYTIGSRSLTRANLADVKKQIENLEAQIDTLRATGSTKRPVRYGVPTDL